MKKISLEPVLLNGKIVLMDKETNKYTEINPVMWCKSKTLYSPLKEGLFEKEVLKDSDYLVFCVPCNGIKVINTSDKKAIEIVEEFDKIEDRKTYTEEEFNKIIKQEKRFCSKSCFKKNSSNEEAKKISDQMDEEIGYKISCVICLKCYYRWIAVRPEQTQLVNLECRNCGQGYVIETGEYLKESEDCE